VRTGLKTELRFSHDREPVTRTGSNVYIFGENRTGSLMELRSGSQSSEYHLLVPLVLLLTWDCYSSHTAITFFPLLLFFSCCCCFSHMVLLFSCDEVISLLIIILLKLILINKNLIIRMWKPDVKTDFSCIYENWLIWEPGELIWEPCEFEKKKKLIAWPVLTSSIYIREPEPAGSYEKSEPPNTENNLVESWKWRFEGKLKFCALCIMTTNLHSHLGGKKSQNIFFHWKEKNYF
jgi:hypothetical protein